MLGSYQLASTRRCQGVGLGIKALAVSADAGISDDHGPLWQKPARTAKVLPGVCVTAKWLILRRAGWTGTKDRI